MNSSDTSNSNNDLRRGSVSFAGIIGIALASFLAIIGPIEVAPFIGDAGPAAIWPVILGALLFILITFPVLEYSKLVTFAGGYYGLAELGYGKAAGKFTAFTNFMYTIPWAASPGPFVAWLFLDSVFYVFHTLLPMWIWFVASILTLVGMFAVSIIRSDKFGKIILYVSLIGFAIVLIFSLFVIAKSPYNSTYYLNPLNSSSGFGGIALATAVVGFYLFTGYGTGLLFSEEAKEGRKTVYKSIYTGLAAGAALIAISVYSEVVGVPLSSLPSVASSALPQVASWSPYFSAIGVFIFNMLIIILSVVSLGTAFAYSGRLIWAQSRDGFLNSKWLKELNPKTQTPMHASLFSLILAIIAAAGFGAVIFSVYGYNPTTIAVAWFADATMGTVLWYFHHFIPEISLFPFLQKHKEIKYSTTRKWIAGVIIPAAGMAFFLYTFYLGILGDLVEPYFGSVLAATILLIFAAVYVLYKRAKGTLGESVVSMRVKE